jgi:hypothetical protein
MNDIPLVIIIIHFLGLARAGYLAAPDNGAERRYTGECSQVPKTGNGCLAVPLNALNRRWEKNSAEEKDYDSGFGRVATCNTRTRYIPLVRVVRRRCQKSRRRWPPNPHDV